MRVVISRYDVPLLLLLYVAIAVAASASNYASLSSAEVYSLLSGLYRNNELVAVEKIARQVIDENPAGTFTAHAGNC